MLCMVTGTENRKEGGRSKISSEKNKRSKGDFRSCCLVEKKEKRKKRGTKMSNLVCFTLIEVKMVILCQNFPSTIEKIENGSHMNLQLYFCLFSYLVNILQNFPLYLFLQQFVYVV